MNDLWKLPASDIANKVITRELKATEVIEQTLQRLDSVNPKINAVVQEMPEEAMAAAKQVDTAIARNENPGTLAGVPVTIKVNVDQKGFATTNGLVGLKDNIATQDTPLVENLRKAGAIIVGRTNTPAFSMRWFTRNTVHGHTLNPRNKNLTPGGSSGGGAAAVAAGIGAIGHGTDIAGSIRYPAYACGLHGLRPTLGRIPALNQSLPDRHICPQITAVSGPMARTVRDIELGYEAMSQPSPLDPWWVPAPRNSGQFEKTAALCTHPDQLETVPEIVSALERSARQLEEDGWKIVETDSPPMRRPMQLQIQFWMAEYFLTQGKAVADEDDPDANFVYEQLTSLCEPPTLESLMSLTQERVGLVRDWQLFLSQYPVLLCPVSAELPFTDLQDIQSPAAFKGIIEAQMPQIGIPFISVPAMTVTTGVSGNHPLGVQLVSDRYREDVLLKAARTIEDRCDPVQVCDPDW